MLALSALTALSGAVNVRLVSDVPGVGRTGDTIQLTLSPSDVTISEEMDSLIVGFKPIGMRADEVCPIHPVDLDIGKYREFGLNNAFRRVNVISSIQADIPEVDIDTLLRDYAVQERALGGFIPTVTQLNADAGNINWDIKAQLAKRIEAGLALDREVRVWTMLTDPNSWNAANRAIIAAGAEWNDADNANGIRDIMDRIEASAQQVTGIWLQPPVAHALILQKATLGYIRAMGGDAGALSRDIVDASASAANANIDFTIPGLPPFHVCASKVLNETSGALDYILDDTVVLVSQPPGSETTGEDIMTCKTFRRKGPSGTGYTSREFNLERRGLHGGTFLASGHAEVIKMISGVVGGIIRDTIQ
jgi:hypothetical protein